jgi:hypothetical protein
MRGCPSVVLLLIVDDWAANRLWHTESVRLSRERGALALIC